MQAGGRRFDPGHVHQFLINNSNHLLILLKFNVAKLENIREQCVFLLTHRMPLSVSARTGECLKGGRQVRLAELRLREKTKFTTSVQTLVAKRLATVYPHPRHAPRKVRSVFCSSALALCQTTAAASFNFPSRTNFGHHLAATITQRRRHGARPDSFLYLLRMGYSVPVSF